MTDQERNDALLAVRSQLTGELQHDLLFLQQQVAAAEDAELASALTDIALGLVPQDTKDFMQASLHIGDRRMDAVYAEARRLMQQKEYGKSLTLTAQLCEHIRLHFPETADKRYFCFRNPLEQNLYHLMYHPTKRLLEAPFDFTRYLLLHAFNLIELRRPEEAIPVLEEAIRFDPVNPEPRFELAEVWKIMGDHGKMLAVTKETLPVCASPYALSRCYANMGYYCTEVKDYDNAVCFYFESLLYVNHPAIPAELHHVSLLMGRKIAAPTRKEVLQAFAAYDIKPGLHEDVRSIATALANQAVEAHQWADAVFYLRILAEAGLDSDAAALQKRCEEQLEQTQQPE